MNDAVLVHIEIDRPLLLTAEPTRSLPDLCRVGEARAAIILQIPRDRPAAFRPRADQSDRIRRNPELCPKG